MAGIRNCEPLHVMYPDVGNLVFIIQRICFVLQIVTHCPLYQHNTFDNDLLMQT